MFLEGELLVLVVGYWLLVVGCWLLVSGFWLKVKNKLIITVDRI